MNQGLLEVLACPRCGNDVRAQSASLKCVTCLHTHPIIDGVPNMLVENGIVPQTRSGFDYQWRARLMGKAERRTTVYGYDIAKFMRWFDTTYIAGTVPEDGSAWALDIGCGTAEKARELAQRYRHCNVVAMDQVDAIRSVARENTEVANLHFVQANAWYPPFKPDRFAFTMSIGVLHHTPDTHRAFSAIAPLVAPSGRLATWVYPLAEEDSFWAGLYAQRDRHFLKLGHRLPGPLVMWLCRAYTVIGFPWILQCLKAEYRANRERFPVYPDTRPTLRELYESSVFLAFDNVRPRHQYRHSRQEVCSWYDALGFSQVDSRFPGFFCGTKMSDALTKGTSMMDTLLAQVVEKLEVYLKTILKLGPDIDIKPDVELVEQIGLDSIEAFDAVATLHDMLGVLIPHDFKPATVATVDSLANYIIVTFGPAVAQRFVDLDLSDVEIAQAEPL